MAIVGQAVPDFTATKINGKKFKLSYKLKAGDKNIILFSAVPAGDPIA